jgi:hypothetical protein
MKSVNALFLFCLFALACSSGRGDIIPPEGGGPSPGASRANLAVTRENLVPACGEFFTSLLNTLNATISVTSVASAPDIPVRILGNYYGYAIVHIVEPVIKPDTLLTTAADSLYLLPDSACTTHLQVEFINYYSETGKLFISGELDQYVQWGCKTTSKSGVHTFYIDGTVEFSGDYACTVMFDELKMDLNEFGQPMSMRPEVPVSRPYYGRMTVSSDGADPIMFNPFFYEPEKDPVQ